nr:hypothetical protein BaRGS_030130 [Batillaria attramentaria]
MLRTFSENLLGSVAGMHLFRQYLQGKCGARVYACWMHVQMFYQTRDPQRRWQILTDIKRLYMNDYAVRRLKKGLAQELLVAELLAFEMVPAGVTIKESKLYVDASEVDLNSKRVLRRVHAVLLDALRSYWTKTDAEMEEDGDKDVDQSKSAMDVDDEGVWGVLHRTLLQSLLTPRYVLSTDNTHELELEKYLLLQHMAGDFLPNVEGLLLSPELKERLMDDLNHNGQSSLIFVTQDVLSNVLSIPATQFAVHDVITFRGVMVRRDTVQTGKWRDMQVKYVTSKIQGDAEKVRIEFSKFKGSTIVGVLTEQHRLLAFQYLILASEAPEIVWQVDKMELEKPEKLGYMDLMECIKCPDQYEFFATFLTGQKKAKVLQLQYCRTVYAAEMVKGKKLQCLDDSLVKKMSGKTAVTLKDAMEVQAVVLAHLDKRWFPRYIDGWPTDELLMECREDPNEPWLVTWQRHYSHNVGEEPDQWEVESYTTVDWSAHPVYFRKLLTKPPNSPGAKPIPIVVNKLTADLRFWMEVFRFKYV